MGANRAIRLLAITLAATAFAVGLSHSETKKETRSSARLLSTASRPPLKVSAAQIDGPLTPADFLVLNHFKNKANFGSHTVTTVSEFEFGTVTLGDLQDFPVVYLEPEWSNYDNLTNVMGELTSYVNGGGVLVINIAGNIGSRFDIAPGGVDYDRSNTHESEFIRLPDHPYITGEGYGGSALSTSDFNSWSSTDNGVLTHLPPNATVILQTPHGPSLVVYPFGNGGVIVSTLTYGGVGPSAPHVNLIGYAFDLTTGFNTLSINNSFFLNASPVTITGTVGRESGIVRVAVQVRDETPVDATLDTLTTPFTFSRGNVTLNEGLNRITATGFSIEDNAVTSDTTSLTLDTVAPSIVITSPANSSSLSVAGTLQVTGDVADDNLRDVRVNGIPVAVSNGVFSVAFHVGGGAFEISAVATDRAGNTATSTVTVDITVSSPNLFDGAGFLYDVQISDGALNDGGNTTPGQESDDAYDGWGEFHVNGTQYLNNESGGGGDSPVGLQSLSPPAEVSFEEHGREIVLPAVLIESLDVYRKIYVPSSGPGFARYINAVHNPTDDPITVDLSFTGNLGSDELTRLQGTSSGNQSDVTAGEDTWFVTDDSDLEGDMDAALAHVFDGAGGVDQADSVFFEGAEGDDGDDHPEVFWNNVTIAPGETKIYLFFESQRDQATQAVSAAEYIANLPQELFEGMSSDELLAVQNFPLGTFSTAELQLGLRYSNNTNPPFQTPGFGVAGDTLWIPVYLTIVDGPASVGVQFSVILTDTDRAEPQGFRLSPALQDLGFRARDNTLIINGEEDVSIQTRVVLYSSFGVAGDTLRSAGETDENGNLIGIPTGETYLGSMGYRLEDAAQLGDTYNLELSGVLIGDQSGDPISPQGSDNADLHVGIRGDINRDGHINILDVVQFVRILIGRTEIQESGSTDWLIADANTDGNLDVADVVSLVNGILGIPPALPKAITGAPATVALGAAYTLSDGRLVVPVLFDNASAVAAAQLTVTFDPSRVTVGSPLLTGRSNGMTIDSQEVDGTLKIVFYSLTQGSSTQPGTGIVLLIPVSLTGDDDQGSALTLSDATLADVTANLVPVVLGETTIRATAVPIAFALRTASPNPFNPSTTIAYETPQQAHLSLTIYNLLGQEVIRLVDEVKAAGRYSVTWDGTNAHGTGVASGVYLYRLTSQAGFVETRRMTLLK